MLQTVAAMNGSSRWKDVDAHARVMALSSHAVVRELVDVLGATNVAVIGGVNETRAVQQWMTSRVPQRLDELRFALQLVMMIADKADAQTARAWFQGSNPHLDDKVPALMLREQPLSQIQRPLMEAARAFALRP